MHEIFFDHLLRILELSAMKSAGEKATGAEIKHPSKNSLDMDGLDELLRTYGNLVQLIIAYGSLVEKDAKTLQNISEAFKKTDQSAAGGSIAGAVVGAVSAIGAATSAVVK